MKVVFHIYKVDVQFTPPNKLMRHPFENNALHIKLWGASFLNRPAYFGQHENDDHRVLSSYISSCVSFVCAHVHKTQRLLRYTLSLFP
jgi:hypothetical protein